MSDAAPAAAPLAGRVALVTGASRGIGRAIALELGRLGATVVGTSTTEAGARGTGEALAAAGVAGRGAVLDVGDAAASDALVEAIGKADGPIAVLVNNAGYGLGGAVEELDDAECRHVMETNFFGTLNLIKAVLPSMRKRRSGHIINFSSMAGIVGFPGFGLYNASKFAVSGLTEALAGELAPFGIRATVVEPGGFRTNFAGGSLAIARNPMVEYAETAAARPRGMKEHYHGTQQGDPAKAAAAVISIVDVANPPVHLLLGPDAVAAARGKLERFGAEIAAWESLSSSTDYST
jgi:NAD(P)-dependent dehydrogenase (short-subunit alcohol dehydrogenase family)